MVYCDGSIGRAIKKKERAKKQRQKLKEENEKREKAARRPKKSNEQNTSILIRLKGKKVPSADEVVATYVKSRSWNNIRLFVVVNGDKLEVKKNAKGRYYYSHL